MTVVKTWQYFHCDLKTGAAEKPASAKNGDGLPAFGAAHWAQRRSVLRFTCRLSRPARLGARRARSRFGNRGRGRALPAVWAWPPARPRTNPAGRPGRRPRSSFPPIQRPRAAAGHANESKSILSQYGPVAHPRRSRTASGPLLHMQALRAAGVAGTAQRGGGPLVAPNNAHRRQDALVGAAGRQDTLVGNYLLVLKSIGVLVQTPESRLGLLPHMCEWMFAGQGHDSCISFKVIYMQLNQ